MLEYFLIINCPNEKEIFFHSFSPGSPGINLQSLCPLSDQASEYSQTSVPDF